MTIDKTQVANAIAAQIQSTVDSLVNVSPAAKAQMSTFLASVQPDIDAAITVSDQLSLDFINDRIAGKLGSIALAASSQQRADINLAITTMLQLGLRIGLAALITAA